MPRATYERQTCKACGKNRSEVGHVTWRGYCITCGIARHDDEVDQLRAGSGPHFEHWARRSLMAAHRALVASRGEEA